MRGIQLRSPGATDSSSAKDLHLGLAVGFVSTLSMYGGAMKSGFAITLLSGTAQTAQTAQDGESFRTNCGVSVFRSQNPDNNVAIVVERQQSLASKNCSTEMRPTPTAVVSRDGENTNPGLRRRSFVLLLGSWNHAWLGSELQWVGLQIVSSQAKSSLVCRLCTYGCGRADKSRISRPKEDVAF